MAGPTSAKVTASPLSAEDAIREWGARRLTGDQWVAGGSRLIERIDVESDSVSVEFSIDEGSPCCTGERDPMCYCSQEVAPSYEVTITGRTTGGNHLYATIDLRSFDFHQMLAELLAIGQGQVD